MAIETFDVLENKVQQVVQMMHSLQKEAHDLRAKNSAFAQQSQELQAKNEKLLAELNALHARYASVGEENNRLKSEFSVWQDRLKQLLGKISDIR